MDGLKWIIVYHLTNQLFELLFAMERFKLKEELTAKRHTKITSENVALQVVDGEEAIFLKNDHLLF